jgi:Multicopper oxidase
MIVTSINGKGRYHGGPSSPLSVTSVQLGKRYRFRLIAMSCDLDYVFSIDRHWMTVIEADGENTIPHAVDSLHILWSYTLIKWLTIIGSGRCPITAILVLKEETTSPFSGTQVLHTPIHQPILLWHHQVSYLSRKPTFMHCPILYLLETHLSGALTLLSFSLLLWTSPH